MIIEGIEIEDKATVFLTTHFRMDGKTEKKERRGHRFEYLGATWYVHSEIDGESWVASEEVTGAAGGRGATLNGAILNLLANTRRHKITPRKLQKQIRQMKKYAEECAA